MYIKPVAVLTCNFTRGGKILNSKHTITQTSLTQEQNMLMCSLNGIWVIKMERKY